MRNILSWLKQNFYFTILVFILIVAAVISLSYAFLRGGNNVQDSLSTPAFVNTNLNHLPLAEVVNDSNTNEGSGSATLGANTKCVDNKTALTAVNLKIAREVNRHENEVKEIGHGGLMKKVLQDLKMDQENRRHLKAMDALQAEYASLIAQINC
jgi:hypothetical protein